MYAPLRPLLPAALFAILCATAAPSARAEMVVSAPAPATAQLLTTWYTHHIPARYRAASRLNVRELPDADMDNYLRGGSTDTAHAAGDDMADIDGVYESDPDRMALRLFPERGADMYTFAHEYGHYVWFRLLSEDDRRRYDALYKRRRAAGHLVTRYAETSVEEGFAEAFSFYAAEPPILAARDPASFQFLAQWGQHSHSAP